MGSGWPADPHPISRCLGRKAGQPTLPFPCTGSPARCLTSATLCHLHDGPVRWLLVAHFTDEDTEAQSLWLPSIRESRDSRETVLLGAFVTQCVLYILYIFLRLL